MVNVLAKLLICDDEKGLREVIKRYAEYEGHKVTEATNGNEAIDLFKRNSFDLIIMDIMMPEMDGFTALKEIRKTSNIPVILLTAKGEEYDRIAGFEMGVDDYVVKPFSSKELMLRVNAILRRVDNKCDDKENTHNVFVKDKLVVDMTAYKVIIDDVEIEMAPKEYELLFFLVRNVNIAVSRERILTEVWGYDYFGDDRTLDTHMKLLRRSLGSYGKSIVTIRGMGYRFEG